jgi:metal-responsive CopG/Arc/MetJ family transcriptional regulator
MYGLAMVHAHTEVAIWIPRDLVEKVDERAADEMRSRTNLVKVLVVEGLERRATEPKES